MEDLEKRGHRTRRPTAGPAGQREVEPLNVRLTGSCQRRALSRALVSGSEEANTPPPTTPRQNLCRDLLEVSYSQSPFTLNDDSPV